MTSPYYKDPIIIDATVTRQHGHVMTDHLVIIHIVLTTLAVLLLAHQLPSGLLSPFQTKKTELLLFLLVVLMIQHGLICTWLQHNCLRSLGANFQPHQLLKRNASTMRRLYCGHYWAVNGRGPENKHPLLYIAPWSQSLLLGAQDSEVL